MSYAIILLKLVITNLRAGKDSTAGLSNMCLKGDPMSEEERKFLEIVNLKKGFGSGETRQEVLRGMNFSVAKGEFCVRSDRLDPENPLY